MNLVNKKYFINFFRILISATLVYLVLKQVHWNDYVEIDIYGNEIHNSGIISSVMNVKQSYLLLAIFCIIIGKIIIGIRWHLLLHLLSINVRIQEAIKLTFLSDFISLLLPGFLGGDLVKAYLVSKRTNKTLFTFVSIFIDRLIGFTGYFVVAICMLIITLQSDLLSNDQLRTPIVTIMIMLSVITMVIISIIFIKLFHFSIIDIVFKKIHFMKYMHEILDTISLLLNKSSLPKLIGLTLFVQLLSIIAVMLVGLGLSLQIPWYMYFLYVPLIIIISAVPITPGSVGVMEELYLIYFVSASNNSKVLVLAVLVRFTIMISNLPGGLVAMLDKQAFKTNIKEVRNSIYK